MTARTSRLGAVRPLLWASLLVLPALTVACRDSGGEGSPDANPGTDVDAGVDTTIYKVQGDLPEGVGVTIRGVVVVAIDEYAANGKGKFWVMEPEGGPFSGVLVYGAKLTELADVKVGDLVDIEGVAKKEFVYRRNPNDTSFGPPLTELEPVKGGAVTVTVTGTGTVPAPQIVDPVEIGKLPTPEMQQAAWEQWEGVLVRVNNASVLSALKPVGDDPLFKEFDLRGPAKVDSSLTELPAAAAIGNCYASVTGVVDYFYNYKILPRSTADIDTTAGTCPIVEEQSAEACADKVDNDSDGKIDCADVSCRDNIAACYTTATVADVQEGKIAPPKVAYLKNVFITARSENGQRIWVADSLTAAPLNGTLVFRSGATPSPELAVGATVDVIGNVIEFDTNDMGDKLTEITADPALPSAERTQPTVRLVAAPTAQPTALAGVSITTLAEIATTPGTPNGGEAYEGVLVQVANLKVKQIGTSNRVTLEDLAGKTLVMDDGALAYDAGTAAMPKPGFTVGTCFSSITGVMSVDVGQNPDFRNINPVSESVLVRGDTCSPPPPPPLAP